MPTEISPARAFRGQERERFEVASKPADSSLFGPASSEQAVQLWGPPRSRSRVAIVIVTVMLCGSVGAAAYWTLNKRWLDTISQLEEQNRRLQEQRNEALRGRSTAEALLKVKLAEPAAEDSGLVRREPAGPAAGKRSSGPAARRLHNGVRDAPQRRSPPKTAHRKTNNSGIRRSPPEKIEVPSVRKKDVPDDPLGGLTL
jgi:hypothetical protein